MSEEEQKLLDEVYQYLLQNSVPLEPEFSKIVTDNFWELLA